MPHADPDNAAVPAAQPAPKPATSESAPGVARQPGQEALENSGWAMGDSPFAE